jgi:predicted dehydrogenase
VGAWWPPGHIIGYEHEFTHAVADFLTAMEQGATITPNLRDGMLDMQVLEAAIISSREGRKIKVADVGQ